MDFVLPGAWCTILLLLYAKGKQVLYLRKPSASVRPNIPFPTPEKKRKEGLGSGLHFSLPSLFLFLIPPPVHPRVVVFETASSFIFTPQNSGFCNSGASASASLKATPGLVSALLPPPPVDSLRPPPPTLALLFVIEEGGNWGRGAATAVERRRRRRRGGGSCQIRPLAFCPSPVLRAAVLGRSARREFAGKTTLHLLYIMQQGFCTVSIRDLRYTKRTHCIHALQQWLGESRAAGIAAYFDPYTQVQPRYDKQQRMSGNGIKREGERPREKKKRIESENRIGRERKGEPYSFSSRPFFCCDELFRSRR